MIPLAGCKQEQCVADTSRTQQESEREHRLKFAPHITSELHFSSIKTNFYQHNEIVFVTGEVLLSLCNVPVTQKCPANTLLMCSGRILSGSFHTGGNLKICWEFKVLKSKRGMYLLKTLQEKGVSWRGGVQGARQRQELYQQKKHCKSVGEKINKRRAAKHWLRRGTSLYVHSWIHETVSNTPLSSPRLWHKKGNLTAPC